MRTGRRKQVFVLIIVGAACLALGFSAGDSIYFRINKNIDIFGRVYKEIVGNYVDEIDPERFMHEGVDGMLETLDPYTVFIGEKEGDEIDLITHGEYGGVGISIGVRDGGIIVIAPMEGYSAQKQGIRAGDRILEVGGLKVNGINLDSVRSKVRGEPGTEVTMKIAREGEEKPLDFVLVREEIQVSNVSYAGVVESGIGYIRLDRFSRRAGDEVRQAIKDLRAQGMTRGLVLDLRENPGGLLEAAVDIVGNFVPRGKVVVSTRGRTTEDQKLYTVESDPIIPDIPLAVLIDKNSASASEIVAGAIQDLDRGVIVGTRSFGKGLVQTIVPMSYNTSLKITTARYYTPSGRSIQEIDYKHSNKNGVYAITPDSLKHAYKTNHGRTVLDAGGITPDSVVVSEEASMLEQELLRTAMYFKFATSYVRKHPRREDFVPGDPVLREFEQYVKSQKFSYKDEAEKKLAEVKSVLEKERYDSTIIAFLEPINNRLQKEKGNAFSRHALELRRELEAEIVSRYDGEKGRIHAALSYDVQLQAAIGILKVPREYSRRLAAR
ncbi:MAG: S41 family peptidase [Ignavibacteriales bacterium]|nr:S41 family peptidase [Ignavibacteriales bacterium]